MWLTPTKAGTLRSSVPGTVRHRPPHHARCASTVQSEDEAFNAWLDSAIPTFEETRGCRSQQGQCSQVALQAQYAVCAACHGATGRGKCSCPERAQAGRPGGLVHQAPDSTITRTGKRGVHDPDDVYGQANGAHGGHPGRLMPPSIANVIALHPDTFPDQNPETATIAGDAEQRRATVYTTCESIATASEASGHMKRLNAPRISGMNDWYRG